MIEFDPIQTNQMPRGEKIRERIWSVVNASFALTPWFARKARLLACKICGGKLSGSVSIARKCRIDYPWRLSMGDKSSLADGAWAYCLDNITIGKNCCIGEDVRLLTGTHSVSSPHLDLVTKPITIHDNVWIATAAIVLPGVTIGEGAVIGAGSVVTRDVAPWSVVAGNPAKFIKKRELKEG